MYYVLCTTKNELVISQIRKENENVLSVSTYSLKYVKTGSVKNNFSFNNIHSIS